jgi:hypothetical protein
MTYRMNAAIFPLPHMPSWCAQGQLYVYFFTFADLWPSSQFQFHISSQFTTADLILMCHCIQMRLSFMKKQFCGSGRYILSIMMLQSHYSRHLTWTGPYRRQSKVCTITVHCGSLLWSTISETDFYLTSHFKLPWVEMWCFTCKESSDCGGHKNPVWVLTELHKLELISSGVAEVKTLHLAALINYCTH